MDFCPQSVQHSVDMPLLEYIFFNQGRKKVKVSTIEIKRLQTQKSFSTIRHTNLTLTALVTIENDYFFTQFLFCHFILKEDYILFLLLGTEIVIIIIQVRIFLFSFIPKIFLLKSINRLHRFITAGSSFPVPLSYYTLFRFSLQGKSY